MTHFSELICNYSLAMNSDNSDDTDESKKSGMNFFSNCVCLENVEWKRCWQQRVGPSLHKIIGKNISSPLGFP